MEQIQILNNGDTLNAIRTKINENFQLTREAIENSTTNPFVKFSANSGNETDGVADLLTRSEDGTHLTFKVGGDYPNLVYTNGSGETFEVSSLDPLYFENLQAGTYIILVRGTSTQITNANIHYQLVEPTEVNSGDIWFNGNGAYQALVLDEDVQWMNYSFTPIGEATFRTDKIAFSSTYPYNSNRLYEASPSSYGLLRTAAVVDELNCHCEDAIITPANLYSLNNYRTMNTEYQVDEKVACPYHHNLQLKCIVAGTTSNEVLDTKGTLEPGTTITDGTVTWEVEELGTDTKALNEMLDEKVDKENLIPINAYVVESYESGYDGFVKFSNGLLIQWGLNSSTSNNATVTVTFLEPYKNTNYATFVTPHSINNRTTNYASMSRSTGSMTLYVESWAYWFTIGYGEVENG